MLAELKYWILGTFLVLIVAVALTVRPAYRALKNWRAEWLATSALEYFEKGSYNEAKEAVSAAFQLTPRNVEVLRKTARILHGMRDPYVMSLWQGLDDMGVINDEERRLFAQTVFVFGNPGKAYLIMEPLLDSEQPQVDDLMLAYRTLLMSGERQQASRILERALKIEPDNAQAQYFLVRSWLEEAHPEASGQAEILLDSLQHGEDEMGWDVLLAMAEDAHFPESVRVKAARLVVEHSDLTFKDILRAETVWCELCPEERSERVPEVMRRLDTENIEELVLTVRWLNQIGAYEQVLTLVSLEQSLKRQDLFGVRMDALAMLGRWKRIQEILEDAINAPIGVFHRALYLFRSLMEQGLTDEAAFHWEHALMPGPDLDKRLLFAADYAARAGFYEMAQKAFERLRQSPSTAREGYAGLMRIARAQGNAQVILQLLESMKIDYPHNDSVQNDLNYFRLLLGNSVSKAQASARDLYEANPNVMAFRATYAFALWQQGEGDKALELLAVEGLNWSQLTPLWQYIRLLVLQRAGEGGGDEAWQSLLKTGWCPLSEEIKLLKGGFQGLK